MTIGAFHAYFRLDGITAGDVNAGIKAFNLDFGDEEITTGIISINGSGFNINGSDAWYTLDGRKLDGKPTTKGLYINNGRKVMIK